MTLRAITASDFEWIKQVFSSTNRKVSPQELDGFIAEEDGRKIGVVTYVIVNNVKQSQPNDQSSMVNSQYNVCSIISLNSLTPGKGIGTALLKKVEEVAKEKGCQVITTESNEATNNFFLKKGFVLREGKLQMVLV